MANENTADQTVVTLARARRLASPFLLAQGLAGVVWWALILTLPETRAPFRAPGAPDSTLLAFITADGLLYAGGSLVTALGVGRRASWAWPLLCVVTGATLYAGLYCLTLPILTGGGWWAALLMLPSTVLTPLFAWLLRPAGGR